MISSETCVQIRRYFFAEHWKSAPLQAPLNLHPDTVRRAIEVERFQHAEPLRPSIVDPYLPLVRQTLEQHPRLRATRLYQMIQDRGYTRIQTVATRLFSGGPWLAWPVRAECVPSFDPAHSKAAPLLPR